MRLFLALLFSLLSIPVFSQFYNGFEFGKVTYAEAGMTSYPLDTGAYAVVLDEFGEGRVDNGGIHNLLFEYHVKIKILKKKGLEMANFTIPLYKDGAQKQRLIEAEAITFNIKNKQLTQTRLDKKKIFINAINENREEAVFALPDVVVGSVIEVRYFLESPFLFTFWPWSFQSKVPKVKSEYWARIPGNFVYNISLRGFLKLSSYEVVTVRDCFPPGGKMSACMLHKYTMTNIPAFKEEAYMTASRNFLSAIDFELSEFKDAAGEARKYTKTWKDVNRELLEHERFGLQIRKAKNLFEKSIPAMVDHELNSENRARIAYQYVQQRYRWNGNDGKYTEWGVKDAQDKGQGNVADVNLSLIGALQAAGLECDPIILATREAGLPNPLYPVVTDFNYVVAYVKIGKEQLLLDATDPLLPFGLLPWRCFNGQGRLVTKDELKSNWIDIEPREKKKKNIMANLTLSKNGLSGDISISSYGYEALDKRKKILLETNVNAYVQKINKEIIGYEISDYTVQHLEDPAQPLTETMKVAKTDGLNNAALIYIDPFFIDKQVSNPFKLSERLYPVDFGVPQEFTYLLNLFYDSTYSPEELPQNAALALPSGGGRYVFTVTRMSDKVVLLNSLTISKKLYPADEYESLKELFNRIVQSQNTPIVLRQQ